MSFATHSGSSRSVLVRIKGLRRTSLALACAMLWATTPVAALPTDYTVEQGSVSAEHTQDSLSFTIDSNQAILNFPQFDVGALESVVFHFSQASPTASVLNRVTGGSLSTIAGALLSNGLVLLINPAGIHITETARINTAGFIASTMNITNDDFLHGRFHFEGTDPVAVINQGQITAQPGGLIALLGGAVQNDGSLVAELGTVALASGKQATLSFDGHGWLAVAVEQPLDQVARGLDGKPLASAIEQSGTIRAAGGRVLVQAKAVEGLFDRVITVPHGVIEASSVIERGGHIELIGEGGAIAQSGTLRADGAGAAGDILIQSNGATLLEDGSITQATGTTGGTIRVLGRLVGLTGSSLVDVSGTQGGGTALIGGDYQGSGPEMSAWQTLVGTGSIIRADAKDTGDGGRVIVWSDDATRFDGLITARGGSLGGQGGFSEVSGKESLVFRGHVDLSAIDGSSGTLLLDPALIALAGGVGDGNDPEARTDELKKGQVLFSDNPSTFTVYESELENTDANIILQARDGISTTGSFGGAQVLLKNNRNLSLETRNALGDGATGINLTTSLDGANLEFKTQGLGTITIKTGTGSNPLNAPITLGKLTSGGTGTITVIGTGTVTVNGAITTADSGVSVPTSSIALASTKAAVVLNADVKTGNASVTDTKKNQTAQTGSIAISAGTSITGSGRVVTGNALISGALLMGVDQATSGSILLTAGTGGVSGGIGLSHPQALATGSATRGPSGVGSDSATAGSIGLISRDAITNGTPGSPLGLTLGLASNAAVNTQGALSVMTIGAGGNIAVTSGSPLALGALATPSGSAQTIQISTTGGANLTLNNASENVTGDAISFNAGAGTVTLLASNFTIGAGSLTLTGDEVNLSGGANSLRGTGSVLLQPSTASRLVHVGGSVDLASRFDLLTTELAALQDGFGSITIGRADATGGMLIEASTFRDPVTLRSPLGGTIAVTGQVTGQDNASITIQGVGSTTTLAGNLVTAGNAITIQDAVQLVGNVLLDTTNGGAASGGGSITVSGAINADSAANVRALTLRAGTLGDLTLGAIGSTQALQSLTVVSANTANLSSIRTQDGGISVNATTIKLSNDLTTDAGSNSGAITLTGATQLQAPVLLKSDHATGADGIITISAIDGAQDLTINAGFSTTTFGAVGSITPLGDGTGAALTLTSLGLTTFSGSLKTASGVIANGPVTFAGPVNLGAGDTATLFKGDVTLDGVSFTSAGSVTFGDAASDKVLLTAGPVALQTTNAPILVNGTLDGAQNLTVNAGTSTTTFKQAVGGVTPIGTGTGLALNLQSSGLTTFEGTLKTASGMNATGPVHVLQNVTLGHGNIGSTFNGDVTLEAGTFSAADGVTFGDAATDALLLASGPIALNSTNAPILVNGTLDGAQNLMINAGTGTTTFNQAVGGITPLGTGTGAALTLGSSGLTTFKNTLATASGITASGPVRFEATTLLGHGDTTTSFAGNVTLAGAHFTAVDGVTFGDAATDSLLLTNGPGTLATTDAPILVNGTLDGAQNLTVNAGTAATTFKRAVGGVTPIGTGTGLALDLQSSGLTTFESTLTTASGISAEGLVNFLQDVTLGAGDTASFFKGDVALAGISFTAGGGVTFGDAATDALLLSTGPVTLHATNAPILVVGTLDGAQNLTINAGTGTTTFQHAVGGVTPLGTGTGLALQLQSSGLTTFKNTLTTASGISAAGPVRFEGAVTLSDGDTATSFAGNVTLAGISFSAVDGVTFGDAATDALLLSDGPVTLTTTDAPILVNGTLDGAQNLTINAGTGTTTFKQAVGGVTPLGTGIGAALTLNSSGPTSFNKALTMASGVIASGPVTFLGDASLGAGDTASFFHGDVTLAGVVFAAAGGVTFGDAATDALLLTTGPVALQTTNAPILVNGTLDGAQNLTINAGTGGTTFKQAVGGVTPLGTGIGAALTLQSSGLTTFEGILKTASGITAAGPIHFLQDVTLGDGDTASTLNGDVTLEALALSAADGISFGDAAADAIQLNGDVSVTTINTPINFLSTLNGAHALGLNSGAGAINFGRPIGAIAPPSLTIHQAGDVNFLSAAHLGALSQEDGAGTTTIGAVVVVDTDPTLINDAIAFSGSLQTNTTTGHITLTAQTGAITSGTAAADVVGATLTATAATGIGSAVNPLATSVDSVTASVTGAGDLALSDSDALTVQSASTANGSIFITSGGTLTVSNTGAIASGAGADVSLTATSGNLLIGLAQAADDLALTATTGSIQEFSPDVAPDVVGDELTVTAATGVGTVPSPLSTAVNRLSGAVTGTGDLVVSDQDAITLGNLTTADGAVIITAGGTITIDNGSVIANGAGQDVTVTATTGDILVGHVQAADTVTLTATAGGIEEYNPDAEADIIAPTMTLSAATGIGTLQAIETDVDTMNLTTGAGGVTLHDLGAFTLNPITIATNGNVNLTADGTLQVAPLADIKVTGTGTLTLTAGAGGVGSLIVPEDPIAPKNTLGASLHSDSGNITLHDAGGMDVWRVMSGTGNLSATSAGDITLRDYFKTGSAGTITINAGGLLAGKWFIETKQGNITLHSGGLMNLVRVDSVDGSLQATSAHDIQVLDAFTVDGLGSVSMVANDSITLSDNANVRSGPNGSLTLTAGNDGSGQLIAKTGTSILSTDGAINLTSHGTMNLWRVASAAGSITASGQDVTIGDSITTTNGGAINVSALDALTINPNVFLRVSGSANLTLAAGTDGTGNLIMGAGSQLNSISGQIQTTSGTLTTLARVASTTGNVSLTSLADMTLIDVVSTGGAGTITAAANDTITLGPTASVRVVDGTMSLTAGADNVGGNFTMQTGSSLQSQTGLITLASNTDMSLQAITSTSGAIQAVSYKALSTHATISTGSAGTVSLTTNDAITTGTGSLIRTTGTGALTIAAGADGVGGNLTMNTGTSVTTASGKITLSDAGGMDLQTVTSTGGNIAITSQGGMTLRNTISTGGAGTVTVNAKDLLSLQLPLNVLIRTTGTGALTLTSGTDGTGDFSMSTDSAVQTNSGLLSLNGAGVMTLSRVSSTSGSIQAVAKNDMNIIGPVSTDLGGTILLQAGDALLMASTGSAKVTGTGSLHAVSGSDGTGNFAMSLGSLLQTGSGALLIDSASDLTLAQATSTSGNIQATAGKAMDVLAASVTANGAGNVTLTANDSITVETGALVRALGTGGVSITAGADNAGGDLTTLGTGLVQTAGGQITLASNGDMTLARLTSASGNMQANAGKNLTLNNTIITGLGGTINLSAKDIVTVGATGFVRQTGTGSLSVLSGSDGTGGMTMLAGSQLMGNSGPINVTANGDLITDRLTSTNGSINVTGTKTVTVQNNVTTAGVGGIGISANTGLTLNTGVLVRATGRGNVSLASGAGGAGGDFTMGTSASIESGTGTMSLNSGANTMTLWRLSSAGGPVNVTSGQTLLLNNTAVVTGGAGGISMSSQKTMTLAANSVVRTTGTGGITLAGGADGLGTDLTTGNSASIEAGGSITLSASGRVFPHQVTSTGGNITITGGTEVSLPNTVSTAGSGVITVTGHDFVRVRRLEAQTPISVTATAGPIERLHQQDPNADGTNIVGPSVTLTAVTGIGTGIDGPLQTSVDSLNALTTGTGNILISELNGITLTSVHAADGSVTISAGGPMTISNSSVIADGLAHNVALTTTVGDILVGKVQATNQVTLTAAGSILENGSDPDADILGAIGVLSAGVDIGHSANPLETSLDAVSATATSGGIFLTDTDGIALNTLTAGTTITISNLAGDLQVGSVTAGGGINLTAVGSILDANADAVNLTASGNSVLTAGNVIGVLADALDVAITNATLSVSAGGEIDGLSANLAGSVTPSNSLIVIGTPPGDVLFNGTPQ